jgi:hypothetical protein
MRDRLIEILEQMSCHYYEDCDQQDCVECGRMEIYDSDIKKIANHLIANGVIVPPCKVGDTVYWYGLVNHLVEAKIVAIDSGAKARVEKIDYEYDLLGEDFGKTVFFTKEDAEQALKEREKK